MGLLIPFLIAQGAQTASTLLSKPKNIKTDTSAIQRRISQMESQNAKSDVYNQGVKSIAQNVNPQIRLAQEQQQQQINRSGLANTPYSTMQETALQQAGLEQTARLAENAMAQEIQQEQQNKSAIQQAREHIAMLKAQDAQANKQAEQQWKTALISQGLGTIAGATGAFLQDKETAMAKQQMLSALSDQYTSAGLNPETVQATVMKYKDNPDLANNVLNSNLARKQAEDKATQVFETNRNFLQSILTPDQMNTINTTTDPYAKSRLIYQALSSPENEAKMNVYQQQIIDQAVRPEIEKFAEQMKISADDYKSAPFSVLSNVVNREFAVQQSIANETPSIQQKYATYSATDKPSTALRKAEIDDNNERFDTLIPAYNQVLRTKDDKDFVSNVKKAISSGMIDYNVAKNMLDERVQNAPTIKPATAGKTTVGDKIAKETAEVVVPVNSAVNSLKNTNVFDGAFFKYNDKDGMLRKSVLRLEKNPDLRNITNALEKVNEKIIGMSRAMIKLQNNPNKTDEYSKLSGYKNQLEIMRANLEDASKSYQNVLKLKVNEDVTQF